MRCFDLNRAPFPPTPSSGRAADADASLAAVRRKKCDDPIRPTSPPQPAHPPLLREIPDTTAADGRLGGFGKSTRPQSNTGNMSQFD
ncbi:unnamed protein product, partial [Iphiclides podalirius]